MVRDNSNNLEEKLGNVEQRVVKLNVPKFATNPENSIELCRGQPIYFISKQ